MSDTCQHQPSLQAPSMVTEAARRYFVSAEATFDLFHFLCHLALSADYVVHTAQRALDGLTADGLSPAQLAKASPGPATKKLRTLRQALLEMVLAREVDNFTTFLSESIRAAIVARPGLIRSRQDVKLEYVLGFQSMEALTEDLIDRKVADLGYKGLDELEAWLESNLGLRLFAVADDAAVIRDAVETRNCIVHARGIVGHKYVANVTPTKFARGQERELDVDDVYAVSAVAFRTVGAFDEQLSNKFGIARTEYALVTTEGAPSAYSHGAADGA